MQANQKDLDDADQKLEDSQYFGGEEVDEQVENLGTFDVQLN